MMTSPSDRKENIVGNPENVELPAFSPFQTMFSKASFSGWLKVVIA